MEHEDKDKDKDEDEDEDGDEGTYKSLPEGGAGDVKIAEIAELWGSGDAEMRFAYYCRRHTYSRPGNSRYENTYAYCHGIKEGREGPKPKKRMSSILLFYAIHVCVLASLARYLGTPSHPIASHLMISAVGK